MLYQYLPARSNEEDIQVQSEHGYSVHWLYKQDGVSQANEHKMSNLSDSQEEEQFYMNN
jgi:(p)ppGpp synthase/HD superfamily hydrolase